MASLFFVGAILLIISALVAIAGFLMVTGNIGSGWTGRMLGAVLMAMAIVAFVVGRWVTNEYAVQRRR